MSDDTVLLATSVEQLQGLVDKVVLESAKKGLCVNTKKTDYMIETKEKNIPSFNLWVHNTKINPKITVTARLRVLECYVLPVLKYGSETWTVSKKMEKRINAAEMN
nr:uncharacterized protein LOC113802211 [Penaeus vannamei]